ncbi:MAG: Gfo/Idh/MocA family oxidoreductase [Anaerolineales bacterium]|nr:Gfo/Idh/MocA family oxidoreductase [Anaerolineales bacterium]
MYDIGVAITGTGFMGPTHTEALRRLGVRVEGILGSSPEKSQKFASQYGIPKAYQDFDEILADKAVQAVHITTPNRWHFDTAKAALLAGKHVLVEKPLTMTSQESAQLVALARTVNLAAGVNYNYRFYPTSLEARQRVRSGEIGEVFSIQGGYVQDWLLYPTDYNWRVLASEGGQLRALADIGTHWMDLVQTITGLEIESLLADLRTVFPVRQRPKGEVETFSGKVQQQQVTEPLSIETEDMGGVMLRFKGGARGMLWVSQLTAGRKNSLRYEIAGSQNAVWFDGERPNELWFGHRDRPNELLLKDPGLMDAAVRPYIGYPGGHNEGYPDSFKMLFKAFYDYIAAGDFNATPQYPTFEEGHREILLCEAILRSANEQRWVTVGA